MSMRRLQGLKLSGRGGLEGPTNGQLVGTTTMAGRSALHKQHLEGRFTDPLDLCKSPKQGCNALEIAKCQASRMAGKGNEAR